MSTRTARRHGMRRAATLAGWGLILSVVGASQSALADVVLTSFSLDGQVRALGRLGELGQGRVGLDEDGAPVLVDEIAVLDSRAGSRVAFKSEGFVADHKLVVARQNESVARTQNAERASGLLRAKRVVSPSQGAVELLIRHQAAHPANHNFTPAPSADFVPQALTKAAAEGQRGFAIVDVGASGRVRRVELLSADGVLSDASLTEAVRAGVKTAFQDERRHDHTVYMAYEVRGQTVVRVGDPFVTLPQCIIVPPGCE